MFTGAMRGLGRNALDLPVAALAGLSAAFVAFAAPGDLLSQLVGATGLPSILPAAEPPLGLKARIGIGGAGAIAVFFAVYLLLRMFDRFGAREQEEELEVAPPRLRRRDFHPDAPSRRPLSAARDLGEPELEPQTGAEPESLEPEPETEPEWQPEPEPAPAAQPAWLTGDPSAEPQVYADPWESTEAEAGPELELGDEFAAFAAPEVEPEPQREAEPEAGPEPEQACLSEPEREPEPEPEPEARLEPEPEPEPQAWREPEPLSEREPEAWRDPEPLPEPVRKPKRPVIEVREEAPPRPDADRSCSIPELMERLERGLARRRYQTPVAAEPPQVFPESTREPADDRLQSAIDSLQRLASRQT